MSGSVKTAIIIGAGPAGLTAARELLERTDIRPVVIEKTGHMGGISRTARYKGNRIDIGGHRFFSKSDRVMKWWTRVMPLKEAPARGKYVGHHGQSRAVEPSAGGPDSAGADRVMLIRQRRSRIYFLRKFFDYPIKLSADTLSKLGLARTVRIGASYLLSAIHQIKPEKTLEDFLINRFGRQLYLTFFKSYTEKVWGVPCDRISAEWGAQRIKGLSLVTAISHFVKSLARRGSSDIRQKGTETSLIEQFMYPKFGPGQLWEYVAEEIEERGGSILTGWTVTEVHADDGRITAVTGVNEGGETRRFEGDYFFSTMPVRDLVRGLDAEVPREAREIGEGLVYRDFITVGMLLRGLRISENGEAGGLLKDNWIYIQEPDVLVGRMQIFNNWSPYMVADPENVWIGLEYFCNETDELWHKSDAEMIALATEEMDRIGIVSPADVLDATVIRVPKTYPAYFGTYSRFDELRDYLDGFENLFLIGRNGMHKYNNQDHSMLTAMTAVDNIVAGRTDKSNIWAVNTEAEYHEAKQEQPAQVRRRGAAAGE